MIMIYIFHFLLLVKFIMLLYMIQPKLMQYRNSN